MIYVSTGGIREVPASARISEWYDNGISAVELSGGAYCESLLDDLLKWKGAIDFRVHNYFPPPKNPFVFNLASLDPSIADRSVAHARKAIEWAVRLDSPVYSFHAGYLLDPQPSELGRVIPRQAISDRRDGMDVFVDRVRDLADFAHGKGIELLIENNVISAANFSEFGTDPLLMTTPEDCTLIMEQAPSNVNLLVDVAHLKVSANTLEFDPVAMFDECSDWIKAYHLSDNNGTEDTNERIRPDSWFWSYLKTDLSYYSIEVYREPPNVLLQLQQLAVAKLER